MLGRFFWVGEEEGEQRKGEGGGEVVGVVSQVVGR